MKGLYVLLGLIFVCRFPAGAQIITSIAANESGADISWPTGIAVDHSGQVYFSDVAARMIRKINSAGVISTYAGTPSGTYSGYITGDGGPATAANLDGPFEIAFDAAGDLYIGNLGYTVRKINTAGIITTVAGRYDTCSLCPTGIGGPATAAYLDSPSAVGTDRQGNFYTSDRRKQIYRIDTSGIITSICGTGISGYNGDGGPATDAQIVYADKMTCDDAGNLYFCDQYRVRKIDASGIITTIAGDSVVGIYNGDGIPATDAQLYPWGLSLDRLGNIFVADWGNSRIRKISPDGLISTIAGFSDYGSYSGHNGDGIQATSALLDFPYDVCVDVAENIYIADAANYRIRKVSGIAGDTAVCVGGTLSLRDIAPGGVWSSSNSNASVNAAGAVK